jgi:hypothetical protein
VAPSGFAILTGIPRDSATFCTARMTVAFITVVVMVVPVMPSTVTYPSRGAPPILTLSRTETPRMNSFQRDGPTLVAWQIPRVTHYPDRVDASSLTCIKVTITRLHLTGRLLP